MPSAVECIALLDFCLTNLSLPAADRALLRELHLAYSQGTHRDWGATNTHRKRDLMAAFQRCREQLNVSQPQV